MRRRQRHPSRPKPKFPRSLCKTEPRKSGRRRVLEMSESNFQVSISLWLCLVLSLIILLLIFSYIVMLVIPYLVSSSLLSYLIIRYSLLHVRSILVSSLCVHTRPQTQCTSLYQSIKHR
jgi:uncharacterized membrane protein